MSHAIISTDKNGIITMINNQTQTLLGYEEKEIVGKVTPEIFFDKEDMKEKAKWNDYDALPLILDVTDIQGIMGISRASAYELVHTPGFPVVRSGRLIKISKKAFFNWLDSGGNFHEDEKEKTT